jgi:hypothetical protein
MRVGRLNWGGERGFAFVRTVFGFKPSSIGWAVATLGAAILGACYVSSSHGAGADTVQQILSANCALNGCHTGGAPAQGLDLSPSAWYASLVGVPATEVTELRVAPGDHASSYLMCKVDPSCTPQVGDHMPLGSGLSPGDVDAIRTWIDSLAADAGPPPDAGDTTPPTFAGVSGATTPVPNSVTLSWSAATDDVTPAANIVYLVYLSAAAGTENFSASTYTTPPGATSFVVPNLGKATTFYFVVRAEDEAGNVDANTVEITATTLNVSDTTPPTFAGATSATPQSASSVALAWSAATDDYTQPANIVYFVYQATSSGGESYGSPSYTTAAGATSYTVTGLSGSTAYYFVVRARDQSGNIDGNTKEVSASTSSVSLSADVYPILSANCTSPGCHTGIKPAESLNMSSLSLAYSNLVGVTSIECPADKRVAPGSPSTSYVMIKLAGSGTCFTGTQMPKTGTSLPQAQIDAIGAWIGEGAPNN